MEVARHWRTRNQRYGLVGEVCESCGKKIFPPRDICPDCEAPAKTPYTFSGLGEVYSYSTVYHAPEGYEDTIPYTVALADIEPQQVSIGMPVEMTTRKVRQEGDLGVIVYGYKFRPIVSTR